MIKRKEAKSYGSQLVPCGINILSRYNDLLVSRYNDLVCRYNDLVSRYNDLASRYNDLLYLSRYNEIDIDYTSPY